MDWGLGWAAGRPEPQRPAQAAAAPPQAVPSCSCATTTSAATAPSGDEALELVGEGGDAGATRRRAKTLTRAVTRGLIP